MKAWLPPSAADVKGFMARGADAVIAADTSLHGFWDKPLPDLLRLLRATPADLTSRCDRAARSWKRGTPRYHPRRSTRVVLRAYGAAVRPIKEAYGDDSGSSTCGRTR